MARFSTELNIKVFHSQEEYQAYFRKHNNSDPSGIFRITYSGKTENKTYDVKCIQFNDGSDITCIVPNAIGIKYKLFENNDAYWAFLRENKHEFDNHIAFSCEDEKYSIHKVVMSDGSEYICFVENEQSIKSAIEESRLDAEDYHNMCRDLDL